MKTKWSSQRPLFLYLSSTWTRAAIKPVTLAQAPEFTTGMNCRNLIVGYNGEIHCCLKANPRPKITWYKNKLPLIDNPKFRMLQAQGTTKRAGIT